MKIISIFTLPILLIFVYSSFIVYQKNIMFKQVEIMKDNLVFVKNIKELIFAIDKEQNAVVKYFLTQKDKVDLQKEFKNSDELYNELLNTVKILNLESKVENLDYDLNRIKEIRQSLDSEKLNLYQISEAYKSTKKNILSSLFFSKHFKYANNYNLDLSKIVDFLSHDENSKYLKELLSSLLESIDKETNLFKNELLNDKNISILFLIIVFFTMGSLFFVLKTIVSKEQESYLKIKTYKDIYEILSKTNKFLTKTYDKSLCIQIFVKF